MHRAHPYDALTPDVILDAVETCGPRCTGSLLALNSYENRVYRVDIEEMGPLVAKFYRPHRWSEAAIREEHQFAALLAEQEIPVVAPTAYGGDTLHRHAGFLFALFPWQPGRAPELNHAADRELLGRYLGRLHRAGSAGRFHHRPQLTIEEFGTHSVTFLIGSPFIPPELHEPFRAVAEMLLAGISRAFETAGSVRSLRLHGDCHLGNVLWNERRGPFLVDLDDCLMGPAMQDLWMLLSGSREEREQQLADVLRGYTEFMDFDARELVLIEALRGLRLLRYNAWIGNRWDDPAFPRAFPWFDSRRFWEDQILTLRQQVAELDEPSLAWSR
ncbi:MAG: serine/threonine protein kinase [Acidithiobacillales bacterium SM1_46]|jgi:Ser/Thr protein kinase RdoA (MazF antagonist)|nr:MAG: serine/threonine protein kinase [Acidithiobacillales bacterium SM1_46]